MGGGQGGGLEPREAVREMLFPTEAHADCAWKGPFLKNIMTNMDSCKK